MPYNWPSMETKIDHDILKKLANFDKTFDQKEQALQHVWKQDIQLLLQPFFSFLTSHA